MGLGLLGRGLGDVEFLARQGARLIVTDLKTPEELAPALRRLRRFRNITFHLGGHRLSDFRCRDFILKAAGVPLDSPYIAEARQRGVPVEMDASLFAKLMPKGLTLVGVTGTRGKTTTAMLIYEALKKAAELGLTGKAGRVFLAGNIKGLATLPLLERVKAADWVVAELDSWQLQGFGEAGISPSVSVFTTFFDDHLRYYQQDRERYFKDKANIFKFQKPGDALIVGEQAGARVSRARPPVSPIIARVSDLPLSWKLKIIGEHNRYNAACALRALDLLGVPRRVSKQVFENFLGVPGRLERLRVIRGVTIYNDTTATTPEATIAALRAIGLSRSGKKAIQKNNRRRRIVLIIGGTDKGLKMFKLIREIPRYCKAVVLLRETGTEKIREKIEGLMIKDPLLVISEADGLNSVVKEAMKIARKGDVVLFSPSFASFGRWFANEYDRGEQFEKIVNSLI